VVVVTDLLIRDVPDEVVAAIDADAGRLGLSRSEYLRRALAQAATRSPGGSITVEDLVFFESVFADLADDDLMRQAWH
jgi:hypothetical protein